MSKVHEVKLGDVFFIPYPGEEKGESFVVAIKGGWGTFNQGIFDMLVERDIPIQRVYSGVRYVGNILTFFSETYKKRVVHESDLVDTFSPWPVDKE